MEGEFEFKEFADEVVGVTGDLVDKFVLGVEGPSLGDEGVIVSVKFGDLVVIGSPSLVVDGASSDFNSDAFPSWNVVEDSPTVSNMRSFKISVDNNVCGGSYSHQSDFVDGQTEAIAESSSFELKFVFSTFYFHFNCHAMNIVVIRNDALDDHVIPDDVSGAALENNILSAGILESQFEFLCESVNHDYRTVGYFHIRDIGKHRVFNVGGERGGRRRDRVFDVEFGDDDFG